MAHTTKDNRDLYYRKAKEDGYRARSAYKLIQIFRAYGIFYPLIDEDTAYRILLNSRCGQCSSISRSHLLEQDDTNFRYKCTSLCRIRNVVDLCAAPGSWSQSIRNMVYNEYNSFKQAADTIRSKNALCLKLDEYCKIEPVIIAIDLQDIAPIDGVYCLKGDITDEKVIENVQNIFLNNVKKHIKQVSEETPSFEYANNAQLITCDGAPDVSGLHETDAFVQAALIRASICVCCSILEPNGIFICKIFFNTQEYPLFRQVSVFFDECSIYKPAASRIASSEHFIFAKGFKPMGRLEMKCLNDKSLNDKCLQDSDERVWLEPLLSCGDLSGYDKLSQLLN